MDLKQRDYDEIIRVFNGYYQTTIDALKEGHPQLARLNDRVIIRMQFDVLWGKIPKMSILGGGFDKLPKPRQEIFYKALAQQIYYVLTEGDFTAMSGYDAATNTFLSQETIARAAISPAAKKTLKDGGLLYAGMNGNFGFTLPYPGKRFS